MTKANMVHIMRVSTCSVAASIGIHVLYANTRNGSPSITSVSGPCTLLELIGKGAVAKLAALLGPADPKKARVRCL